MSPQSRTCLVSSKHSVRAVSDAPAFVKKPRERNILVRPSPYAFGVRGRAGFLDAVHTLADLRLIPPPSSSLCRPLNRSVLERCIGFLRQSESKEHRGLVVEPAQMHTREHLLISLECLDAACVRLHMCTPVYRAVSSLTSGCRTLHR